MGTFVICGFGMWDFGCGKLAFAGARSALALFVARVLANDTDDAFAPNDAA